MAIGLDGQSQEIFTSTRALKARDAYVKLLLRHQLTEQNGWSLRDEPFGGWGCSPSIPKKPVAAIPSPRLESNLSATALALEALQAAGVKDHEVYGRAETFIRRCQKPDGGFRDSRIHSARSATADAVRGLLVCEPIRMKREDESAKGIVARGNKYPSMLGEEWLERNFRPGTDPGWLASESNRDVSYFYNAASMSKALRMPKEMRADRSNLASDLSMELLRRQHPDGSWANPVVRTCENDPLFATSYAMIVLANCKQK